VLLSLRKRGIRLQFMIEQWMRNQSSRQPSLPEPIRLREQLLTQHVIEHSCLSVEASSKC